MAVKKALTHDQIDANVDTLLASKAAKPGTAKSAADVAAIYTVVRPILQAANGLLFFKPKWQQVLTAFIAALDSYFKVVS